MNVFDFDRTIYKRDSTADFFIYALLRHPKILITVPGMTVAFIKYYIFRRGSKTDFKEKLYKFLKYTDVITEVPLFWEKKKSDIKKFYLEIRQSDDVIISASPGFIVRPICDMLGIKNVISSRVNHRTGKYDGINCHGEEKVRRFFEEFPDGKIDKFFSDSYSDQPLAKLANQAYMVKGSKITPWKFKIK